MIDKEYWKKDPTFMDTEKFFDIIGYDGDYQVSNFGNVKSFKLYEDGRVLKPAIDSRKYLQVRLFKNNLGKSKRIHKMQQLIFFNDTNSSIDHIDRNKTNNMLNNLRTASIYENSRNITKRKGASSKYTGVCYCKECKKWRVRIFLNGKNKNLGYFKNEEEAAKVRDDAVKKYRSDTMEFNRFNFEKEVEVNGKEG